MMVLSFSSGLYPSILGYADEAMLAFSLFILIFTAITKAKIHTFSILLLLYVIYSLFNSYISQFSPNLLYAFLQCIIHMKLFIVAQASIILYLNSRNKAKLVAKTYYLFVFLFFVGIIINFIAGETWNKLLSDEQVQYRYGFIRPAGFFGHYAPNGYFFSLVATTAFMLSTKTFVINKQQQISKFYYLMIMDFFAAFPLTVRKGLFIIIPYGFYILSLLSTSKKIAFGIAASIFIACFLTIISSTEIFSDTLANVTNFFSDDHSYIRGLIAYYGFSLSAEFFPFGVGNGLYGTLFSNLNHSVYKYIGLDLTYLTKSDGTLVGVYDSGISALIAESGFIGAILTVALIKSFFDFNRKNLDTHNYKIFKVLTFFALILSITEPVWQNGFFTTFYIICMLFIYTKNNQYISSGAWVKLNQAQS